MTLPRLRPLLAALFALPLAFAATPARAQVVPGPDAPLPPSAQPLPPGPQPIPNAAPALPYGAPPPYAPPLPYGAPTPYAQPQTYEQPPTYEPPAPSHQPPTYVVHPAQVTWNEPDHERTVPANWYGWQTLIATAPIDIAMFAALAHYSDASGAEAFGIAFAARNLVPAVVHIAHGKPGRGFGSVGLMAASAATGVAIGYAFGLALQPQCAPLDAACRNTFREIPPAAGYGAIAGSMAGTLLDVVFFAHRQRLTWTAAKAEPSWMVAPFAAQGSMGLVAVGTL